MAILADLNTDQQIAVWGLVISVIGIGVTIVIWWLGHKGYGKDKVEKKTEEDSETVIRIRRGKDRIYRIFIGSPQGLETERKACREEVDDYDKIEANHRNIHFVTKGWEDIASEYGRPQSIINKHLIGCDCYILVLWDRWGSETNRDGSKGYSSGSEEEFYLAESLLKNNEMKKIAVYFKKVDEARLSSPDNQLKKVIDFKEKIKREKLLFFKEFDGIDEFKKEIRVIQVVKLHIE